MPVLHDDSRPLGQQVCDFFCGKSDVGILLPEFFQECQLRGSWTDLKQTPRLFVTFVNNIFFREKELDLQQKIATEEKHR